VPRSEPGERSSYVGRVAEGDLARFVSDLVETSLELSEVYASYAGERGYSPLIRSAPESTPWFTQLRGCAIVPA
jgi:hypothetical protein